MYIINSPGIVSHHCEVPVSFADGQATLRYGRAPGDFDPDAVTDNSLLWCYDENNASKDGLWLTLAPYPGNVVFQLSCSPYGDELKYRTRWNYTWYDWRSLA